MSHELWPLTGDSYDGPNTPYQSKSGGHDSERNKVTTITSGGGAGASGRLDDFDKWGGNSAYTQPDANEGLHKTIAREAIGKVKEFIQKARNFEDPHDFG